jgi:hypothetical protein
MSLTLTPLKRRQSGAPGRGRRIGAAGGQGHFHLPIDIGYQGVAEAALTQVIAGPWAASRLPLPAGGL